MTAHRSSKKNRSGPQARPSIARPTRTIVQGGAGLTAAELIDTFHDLSDTQLALVAVLLTALFAWVQVLVEDGFGLALLRDVPEHSTPLVDVDDDAGL